MMFLGCEGIYSCLQISLKINFLRRKKHYFTIVLQHEKKITHMQKELPSAQATAKKYRGHYFKIKLNVYFKGRYQESEKIIHRMAENTCKPQTADL